MADQEHVELEQVPLKSDTDAPAVEEGELMALKLLLASARYLSIALFFHA